MHANGVNQQRKLTGYEYGDEVEFEIPYRKLGQYHLEDGWRSKRDASNWLVYTASREKFQEWCDKFESLHPISGKISGTIGKAAMQKLFGLNNVSVRMVWNLADADKDGMLNCYEFCLAMYLIDLYIKGDIELPAELPTYLYPPILPTKNTL